MIDTHTPILDVRDLSIDYVVRRRQVPAVRNVGFTLNRGEGYALLGGSGAGKSTVALACLGYLPGNAAVVGGQILLRGRDIAHASRQAMQPLWGADLSIVPQDPHAALNPARRVGDQVADVLRARGETDPRAIAARVQALFEMVRLRDPARVAESYPHHLSGGMKQRICIARALAVEPALLVLDEPTTALDVTTQAAILDTIADIRDRLGVALLFITHDLRVVTTLCRRVGIMRGGEMVEQGDAEDLLRRPQHPFTRQLVDAASLMGRDDRRAAAPAAAPLLAVDGLRKTFGQGGLFRARRTVKAIDDVSFTVAPGRTVAIVGESGSGKSTVGRCIMGLLAPDGGRITLGGDDLAATSAGRDRHLRRQLAIVFQNPDSSLNPRHTVRRIITRALPGQRAAGDQVERLLAAVQLDPTLAERLPRELSGGQKQRVAIARAFAAEPQLVVLDEATSSLDLTVQVAVLELLKGLQAARGTAYLFISHDMHVVRRLADDVAVMQHGRFCEFGPVDQVFDRPAQPYTRALLASAEGRLADEAGSAIPDTVE